MSFLYSIITLSFLRPSFWRSLLALRKETDYELILSRLAKDIGDAQTRLARIRTRDARASVALTLYAFALWAATVAVAWTAGWLGWSHREGESDEDRAFRTLTWIPLYLIPFGIIFLRRIVRWWYRRLAEAEEIHIRTLRRTQQDKIDEIKKATHYDRLRMLLDKYDGAPAGGRSVKGGIPKPVGGPQVSSAVAVNGKNDTPRAQFVNHKRADAAHPHRHSMPSNSSLATQAVAELQFPSKDGTSAMPKLAELPDNSMPPPPVPLSARSSSAVKSSTASTSSRPQDRSVAPPAPPRGWMDKFADAILGAPDPSQLANEQRYALICEACCAHNGLAVREEFDEVQYVCPRCGHFNSRRPDSTPISSPFGQRARLESVHRQQREAAMAAEGGDTSMEGRGRTSSSASRRSLSGSGGTAAVTSPSTSSFLHHRSTISHGYPRASMDGLPSGASRGSSTSVNLRAPTHVQQTPYMLRPDGRTYSSSHADLTRPGSAGGNGLASGSDTEDITSPDRLGSPDSLASPKVGEHPHRGSVHSDLGSRLGITRGSGFVSPPPPALKTLSSDEQYEPMEELDQTPRAERVRRGGWGDRSPGRSQMAELADGSPEAPPSKPLMNDDSEDAMDIDSSREEH